MPFHMIDAGPAPAEAPSKFKMIDAGPASEEEQPERQPEPEPHPDTQIHYNEAVQELNLNEQEKALYQRHLQNLWGDGGVNNDDGSRSSLYQAVQEHEGKFYSIPTVWNGKIETEKWTRPSDGKVFDVPNKTAIDNVAKEGWDKFPSYATPEEADARYDAMHKYMEQDTKNYFTPQALKPATDILNIISDLFDKGDLGKTISEQAPAIFAPEAQAYGADTSEPWINLAKSISKHAVGTLSAPASTPSEAIKNVIYSQLSLPALALDSTMGMLGAAIGSITNPTLGELYSLVTGMPREQAFEGVNTAMSVFGPRSKLGGGHLMAESRIMKDVSELYDLFRKEAGGAIEVPTPPAPLKEGEVFGYHGSQDVIDKFDPEKARLGPELFFSDKPELASKFAEGRATDDDPIKILGEDSPADIKNWIQERAGTQEAERIGKLIDEADEAYKKNNEYPSELTNAINDDLKRISRMEQGAPNVSKVRLNLGKVYDVDLGGKFSWEKENEAIQHARENGYNSIRFRNSGEQGDFYAVLDHSQISPEPFTAPSAERQPPTPLPNPIKEANDVITQQHTPDVTWESSPSDAAEQAVPHDLSAAVSPPEARVINGHKPGEYDERGKEWVSKIDEPDDVKDVIEGIAQENDWFPVARGGEASLEARNAVAEAAGIHPSELDPLDFSTRFDNDGKVRAVVQVLRQTVKDYKEAADKASEAPTEENLAAEAEALQRHTHVLEYTMGLRAESGRSLNAWKDLLKEVERSRAKVDLQGKEATGEAPKGTGELIDAASDVENNLKKQGKKRPGLDKLIESAQNLIDQAEKPAPPGATKQRNVEVQSLVDEAKNALKAFGASKDADLNAFQEALTALSEGRGKLEDVVEAARALAKKSDKPRTRIEADTEVKAKRSALKSMAKKLVDAADAVLPKPKVRDAELANLMETTRQAVGRLKGQNVSPEIAAFREAVASKDPARAAEAARELIAAEGKEKSPVSKTAPVEYSQTMAAARRVADAMEAKAVPEKPELMPDIADLLHGAGKAAEELGKQRKSVLGDLIKQAEDQAANMTKQREGKKPTEALPPELQGLVDKTKRIVTRFGGVARGERAAFLLGKTGRTAAEQEALVKSVNGLTPDQVAKVMEKIRTSKFGDKPPWYFWLFRARLLTGIATHVGYAGINTITVELERVVTPLAAAILGRSRNLARAAVGLEPKVEQDLSLMAPLHAQVAIINGIGKASRSAWKALQSGERVPLESELRLFARGEESPQATGAATPYGGIGPDWGIWKRVFNETQLNAAAHILGMPYKSANMTHQFYKVLSEEGAAALDAFNTAHQEGLGMFTDRDKFWQRYEYHLDNPTDAALMRRTNDAYSGAYMSKLTGFLGKISEISHVRGIKFLFPFMHIPINVARFKFAYSPAAIFGPETGAAILGKRGLPAQNLAIARMGIGTAVFGYFLHKGFAGEATGDYPLDPKERARWDAEGIQPNSIKMGGWWVSFHGLGPLMGAAAIGTNMAQIIHNYNGEDDPGMTHATLLGVRAGMNTFADDTGFLTLKNFMDGMESEHGFNRFFANLIATQVPIAGSTFVSQASAAHDPYQREAKSVLDNIKYRMLGLRETLPAKRDPVFGEPLANPAYKPSTWVIGGIGPRMTQATTDPIRQEMDRLKMFPAAPQDRIQNVKLTPELYSRYRDAAGSLTRQILERKFNSPAWQNKSEVKQRMEVKEAVDAAREAARGVMVRQHPELRAAVRQQVRDYMSGASETLRPKRTTIQAAPEEAPQEEEAVE